VTVQPVGADQADQQPNFGPDAEMVAGEEDIDADEYEDLDIASAY